MARMTPEEYQAKRERRIKRLEGAAQRTADESDQAYNRADQMAQAIPFGQPILAGHYSEGRDRRYRGRIENGFEKSVKLQQKADALSARAEAARENNAIFSDDPQAEEKLEDKLARLEVRQERMKTANKLVKKGDREGLLNMGFTEAAVDGLFQPDCFGKLGFAPYQITNNGSEIRRIKKRIVGIQAHADDVTTETIIDGIRIVDSVEDNRVQIFFGDKPSEETREKLKHNGFRWTPSIGAWQRNRGAMSVELARRIIQSMQFPA